MGFILFLPLAALQGQRVRRDAEPGRRDARAPRCFRTIRLLDHVFCPHAT